MLKKFYLFSSLFFVAFMSTSSHAMNNIDEERYMIQYSINSNMESSVKLNYQENQIQPQNITDKSVKNNTQIHYSGYQNVQGYKNKNKYKSKRFATIATGVIIAGVVLIGVAIGAVVSAL